MCDVVKNGAIVERMPRLVAYKSRLRCIEFPRVFVDVINHCLFIVVLVLVERVDDCYPLRVL